MKRIPLSKGKFALVDDADYERLMAMDCKWYAHKGHVTIYPARHKQKKGIRKWITLAMDVLQYYKGTAIDHKNHNGLDNRRKNLRICSRSQNLYNKRPLQNTSSKYKGVRVRNNAKDKGRIQAQIGYGGKMKHLGTFKTEKDAATAYDKAAKELFGEYAYLNFPDKCRDSTTDGGE